MDGDIPLISNFKYNFHQEIPNYALRRGFQTGDARRILKTAGKKYLK